MKHLKKITISNARRFAKDVSIDFGQGATILLAPNGTGKTTVFEAIEFALTGAVQRLNSPPISLIRDNMAGVDIRLDFENNLFCEVNYRKGSDPILTGDHNLIFPDRNINEIPYLLRLTHLLEQRGSNWFVQQADKNKAGDLLDKLSIGKELNEISRSKTGAVKASNLALQRAKDILENAKVKLETFQNLIKERENAKSDFILLPLKEIVSKLINVHLLVDKAKPNLEEKLAAIISITAQTESQLNSKLEDNTESIVKVAKVEGFIDEFLSNKQLVATNQSLLKNINEKIDSNRKKAVETSDKLKERNIKELEIKDQKTSLIALRDCFVKIESIVSQIQVVENGISEHNLLNPSTKSKMDEVTKKIELNKEKSDKHELLSEQGVALVKRRRELQSKETLIIDWKELIYKIDNIANTTFPSLKQKAKNHSVQLKEMKVEIELLEQEFIKSQDFLTSLKSASDSISGAVSVIANNLPKDEGGCPVCTATYLPEVLQERILKAVSYIDPLLNDAISNNKSLHDKLSKSKSLYSELKEKLDIVKNDIEKVAKQKEILEKEIEENIIPNFSGNSTPNEAVEWIKTEMVKIDKNIENIKSEKDKIGKILDFEELNSLTLNKQKYEREIQLLNSEFQVLLSKKSSLNEELESLKKQYGANSIEEIRKNITGIENVITQHLFDTEKVRKSKSEIESLILEMEKQIISETAKIAQIDSHQNEIRAQWIESGLSGEPNYKLFIEKKESLSKKKNALKKGKEDLTIINEEIAKWKTAEEFEKIDREIKTLSNSAKEPDYLKQLSSIMVNAEKEYSQIEEKIKTLNKLYSKIGTELETTHRYLKEINPLWKGLLSRVVVNPRFAETTLDSYTYRNKPQAEVNVSLHGTTTKVNNIASEAQITDVQLTFMLAMANSYKWTSWKGLLLDDPTQHHDLVHSASVFDLLRDYIINDDYQILLGTHDSIHANFFKRKLDNDGIPARIWNLTSDNDGVKAVEL